MKEQKVEGFAEVISIIAGRMVADATEIFCLEMCPEMVFSTFVFGLIDEWLKFNDKQNREAFIEFVAALRHCGCANYRRERDE